MKVVRALGFLAGTAITVSYFLPWQISGKTILFGLNYLLEMKPQSTALGVAVVACAVWIMTAAIKNLPFRFAGIATAVLVFAQIGLYDQAHPGFSYEPGFLVLVTGALVLLIVSVYARPEFRPWPANAQASPLRAPEGDTRAVGEYAMQRRADGSLVFALPAQEIAMRVVLRLAVGIGVGGISAAIVRPDVTAMILCGVSVGVLGCVGMLWMFTIRLGFSIGEGTLEIRDFENLRIAKTRVSTDEIPRCDYNIEKGARSFVYFLTFNLYTKDRAFALITNNDTSRERLVEFAERMRALLTPYFTAGDMNAPPQKAPKRRKKKI